MGIKLPPLPIFALKSHVAWYGYFSLSFAIITDLTLWMLKSLILPFQSVLLAPLALSCVATSCECSTLFYVHFFCHMFACFFVHTLKVISSSTPHAVSPICQIHVRFMQGATVSAVFLVFVCIFPCLPFYNVHVCLISLPYQSQCFLWLYLIWLLCFLYF